MLLLFILCSWLLLMGIRENNLFWSKDSKSMFLFVLWQQMPQDKLQRGPCSLSVKKKWSFRVGKVSPKLFEYCSAMLLEAAQNECSNKFKINATVKLPELHCQKYQYNVVRCLASLSQRRRPGSAEFVISCCYCRIPLQVPTLSGSFRHISSGAPHHS